MYTLNQRLSHHHRSELNMLRNQRLASAVDLLIKQAHWNVKGSNYIALMELFDKVNEAVACEISISGREARATIDESNA
jgi:DNA-binding ferritin-like protein